jgi:hypothetical protein
VPPPPRPSAPLAGPAGGGPTRPGAGPRSRALRPSPRGVEVFLRHSAPVRPLVLLACPLRPFRLQPCHQLLHLCPALLRPLLISMKT